MLTSLIFLARQEAAEGKQEAFEKYIGGMRRPCVSTGLERMRESNGTNDGNAQQRAFRPSHFRYFFAFASLARAEQSIDL